MSIEVDQWAKSPIEVLCNVNLTMEEAILRGWTGEEVPPVFDMLMTILRAVDVFASDKSISVEDVLLSNVWESKNGIGIDMACRHGAHYRISAVGGLTNDEFIAFKLQTLARACMQEETIQSVQRFLRVLDEVAYRWQVPTSGLLQASHAQWVRSDSILIPVKDNLIEWDEAEYIAMLDAREDAIYDGRFVIPPDFAFV